jgi:hypothetical protein
LLQTGEYEIAGGLKISMSGVVLRGSGVEKTILRATGRDRRTVVTLAGKDDRAIDSERSRLPMRTCR